MKKNLVALSIVFLTALTFANALDLTQAVGLAQKNNPLIRQAKSSLDAAHARKNQAKSGFFPDISAEALYTRLDPSPIIDFPGLGSFQLYPINNYDAHLAIKQLLFDFGKLANTVAAGTDAENAAKETLKLTTDEVTFNTIRTFYSVLLLEQSVDVQKEQINSLNEYLSTTKNKLDSGTATEFDLLTIQVRVAQANTGLMDLNNQLHKQIILLRRLLGAGENEEFTFEGSLSADDFKFEEASLISYAKENRPEIRISKFYESAADKQLKAARRDRWPMFVGGGTWGGKNGYLSDLDVLTNNYVLYVQANLSLFSSFRISNKIAEAEAAKTSAIEHSKDIYDTSIAEIKQEVDNVNTGKAKLESSALYVTLAKKAVDQAKIRYESGVITNLEYLDAETSLAQANLSNLQALYTYTMSTIALKKASGMSLLD
jgi:outer membrane protein